jgi:cysteinyl-tRNA synthetase
MAKRYLGDEIDIHAGGEDLIFPHHENEIAQSEAANGCTFARYWMHNAFLNIDGQKMSKSLGNFRTVRDISENYDLQVLRFFMLSAHYRSPLNFSKDLMDAAANGLLRIRTGVEKLDLALEGPAGAAEGEADAEVLAALAELGKKFDDAMDDDFNTADASAALFEIIRLSNTTVTKENVNAATLKALLAKITELCDVLGIIPRAKKEILDEEVERLIAERTQARKEKNFARADEIREELLRQGIVLEDTRNGVTWKRS